MDDGELDFSNHEMFSSSDLGDFPNNCSMDTFLDEILKDSHACTHTHTCNPPGPDSSHTHTCFHVHTKIVPASNEEKPGSEDTAESAENKGKKRPLGNREAVRKYREKKKARAASLEDEIVRLRAVNQQLLKRLQGQAVLEAEIARLKCLLVDIRGRIEGEIGSFPYQKPAIPANINPNYAAGYAANPCNIQCNDQLYCGIAGLQSGDFDGCDFENLQCVSSPVSELKDIIAGSSVKNKRKGGNRGTNASS
uniref:BZIP domain-containing protein n=1 Tax=Kalanchoe fedtschenkoi TaxID=63787 RepID=A0A7N1A3S9_KALFE